MLYAIVRRNTYQDSLRLMQLSSALDGVEGVEQLSVMMGTPANKELLRAGGLGAPELAAAGPTDLIIVAEAASASAGESLVAKVDDLLARRAVTSKRSGLRSARSLERAMSIIGDANLALVSIPGEYVAAEVSRLLDRDIHAFVFSDNVSVEDEVLLKRSARERGLLVMGPDCGTARVGRIPLGFANEVPEGSIGLVGASGTGLQEIMVQIDRLGGGVSHAIGLGGRDLGADVRGISCLQALSALDEDETTSAIVLVSKPPAPSVREHVIGVARTLSKPVVAHLLGEHPQTEADGNVHFTPTLVDTARVAVELAGPHGSRPVALRREQRWIKALYTGGSLAAEAATLLGGAPGASSNGHEVIDLGDDSYTRGRPHPMIDPSLRTERIPAVFADPAAAVLLLDVVLGHGSAPDPAGPLAAVVADELAPPSCGGSGPCRRRVGLWHGGRPTVAERSDRRARARRRRRAARQRLGGPPRAGHPAPPADAPGLDGRNASADPPAARSAAAHHQHRPARVRREPARTRCRRRALRLAAGGGRRSQAPGAARLARLRCLTCPSTTSDRGLLSVKSELVTH